MNRFRWMSLALLAVLPGSLLGCGGRAHIRDDFGRVTVAHFRKQHAGTTAATGNPIGLDSEEASLIHRSYRDGLTGKDCDADEAETKVLIVEEPSRATAKR